MCMECNTIRITKAILKNSTRLAVLHISASKIMTNSSVKAVLHCQKASHGIDKVGSKNYTRHLWLNFEMV